MGSYAMLQGRAGYSHSRQTFRTVFFKFLLFATKFLFLKRKKVHYIDDGKHVVCSVFRVAFVSFFVTSKAGFFFFLPL